MIQADRNKIIYDLALTKEAFEFVGDDFLKKEYNYYNLLNIALATCYFVRVPGEVLSTQERKDIMAKHDNNAFGTFMRQLYYNESMLKEIGKHLKRFASKIKYKYVPYFDATKTYSEKEFKEILLSYFATYGDKIYKIAKKYFDEQRIHMNAIMPKEGYYGYFSPIIWRESAYIFCKYSQYDTVSLTSLAQELGHAIDAELFLFPQQKKLPLFGDIYVEIPSTAYEIGLYDYLKSQNIDKLGGMILRNSRAGTLITKLTDLRDAFNSKDLEIYENGVGKDANNETYDVKTDILYGLGYYFAFHLSEIRKSSPEEYLKVLNNLMTMRKEMSLEDAIAMTGFNQCDFINGRYIKPSIEEDCMELKKRYYL